MYYTKNVIKSQSIKDAAMFNRSEWISEADQYIQRFAILYKAQIQRNQKEVLKELTAIELGILNLIEWEPLIPLKTIAEYNCGEFL